MQLGGWRGRMTPQSASLDSPSWHVAWTHPKAAEPAGGGRHLLPLRMPPLTNYSPRPAVPAAAAHMLPLQFPKHGEEFKIRFPGQLFWGITHSSPHPGRSSKIQEQLWGPGIICPGEGHNQQGEEAGMARARHGRGQEQGEGNGSCCIAAGEQTRQPRRWRIHL